MYFVAVTFLVYWWIAGLTLVHQKSGVVAAIIGIGLSIFTSGFGMFLVVVISAILHKSWSGVLIFIGFPMLSKVVMNTGLWLMEITPEQVKEKILKFEEEQDSEINEIEKNLNKKESELTQMDKELEELNEILENDFEDDDEDWDDEYYDSISEEEIKAEIERLEIEAQKFEIEAQELEKEIKEGEKAKQEIQEKMTLLNKESEGYKTQIEFIESLRGKDQNELYKMMQENPALKEIVFELLEDQEIEEGTYDKFVRDALIEWRKGNRETALALYNKTLEINPNDALDLLNRGNLLIEMGRFDEGITDLEKARSINPELPTQLIEMLKIMSPEVRENFRQNMLKKNSDKAIE